MNKRFLISVVVVFVLLMAVGFAVHGLLLAQDYAQLTNVFRTPEDSQKYFPFMLLAHAVTAFAIVWIYLQGRQAKPALAQGVRYGLALAAVMVVAKFLIYYAVQPMPGDVVVKQIVFDTIGLVLIGIVVAHLNK